MGVLPIEPEVAKALESMTLLCGQTSWDQRDTSSGTHLSYFCLEQLHWRNIRNYHSPLYGSSKFILGRAMRPIKVINVSTNYDVVCLSCTFLVSIFSVSD
jgi:hypothetical protein